MTWPELSVVLVRQAELEHLDELIVTIRDDADLRLALSDDGVTPEQIAEVVWGPYQFAPSTDAARRETPGEGMLVGEKLSFILYRTRPPSWSPLESEPHAWQLTTGTLLRLRLEARRAGWESWTLPCEIDSAAAQTTVEVPGGPING